RTTSRCSPTTACWPHPRHGCSATRPTVSTPRSPPRATGASRSRSTAGPRASTSPRPPRCASTPPRGACAGGRGSTSVGRVTPLPADPDHDPEQAPAVPPAADELLEQLGDGIVVADAAGRVSLVTGLAARTLEVDAATALGRPLHEVLALQDQEGRDWVTRNAPYTGLSTRSTLTEQAWLLRSGVEVLVVARLIRSQAGGPVERVVLTLRPARWRERLDRERSDLVATVAHELRSPLTGV